MGNGRQHGDDRAERDARKGLGIFHTIQTIDQQLGKSDMNEPQWALVRCNAPGLAGFTLRNLALSRIAFSAEHRQLSLVTL
jgi:hypothetical protein